MQKQIREVEQGHKALFKCVFVVAVGQFVDARVVDGSISRYEGISLIVRSGQQLEQLYCQ